MCKIARFRSSHPWAFGQGVQVLLQRLHTAFGSSRAAKRRSSLCLVQPARNSGRSILNQKQRASATERWMSNRLRPVQPGAKQMNPGPKVRTSSGDRFNEDRARDPVLAKRPRGGRALPTRASIAQFTPRRRTRFKARLVHVEGPPRTPRLTWTRTETRAPPPKRARRRRRGARAAASRRSRPRRTRRRVSSPRSSARGPRSRAPPPRRGAAGSTRRGRTSSAAAEDCEDAQDTLCARCALRTRSRRRSTNCRLGDERRPTRRRSRSRTDSRVGTGGAVPAGGIGCRRP